MPLDIKIELFAFEFFQHFFFKNEMISVKQDIFQIYEEECRSDPEYEAIIYDTRFYLAFACRYALFFDIYSKKVRENRAEYQLSMSDFLDYILRTCNSDDLFGNITIFERLFATCVFVLTLCLHCQNLASIDLIKYSHICWTIYFDEHTEEFHKQGGWIQLKEVAAHYESLIEFIRMSRDCLYKENAIYNYTNFKQKSKFNDCKTIAKSWVKFQIGQTNAHYISDIVSDEVRVHPPETCREIESFLQSLNRLCNPRVSRDFDATEHSTVRIQLPNHEEVSERIHQTFRSTELEKTSSSLEELSSISPITKIPEVLASTKKTSTLESRILEVPPADINMKNIRSQGVLSGHDEVTSSLSYSKGFEKDIPLSKGKVSSSNCKGKSIKIKKCKNIEDDSHNEESIDIDFLRMILVLGDKQGINYVLSTLHGTQELKPARCSNKTIKK